MATNQSPVAELPVRLGRAIEKRFPDVKSFQQVLQREGVKGSSPGSVYAYVDGRAVPSLEFLTAAAEHLNVRVAWLAFGEGEPTEQLERKARGGNLLAFWERVAEEEARLINECLPHANLEARAALQRFADRLEVAGGDEAFWKEPAGKRAVIAGAARYLLSVESAFREAAEEFKRELATNSAPDVDQQYRSSPAQQGVWYDLVLLTFFQRMLAE